MEQENNSNEVGTTAVDLAEASERKSPISKPKSDIVKSMAKNFLKTRKANVTSEVPRKKQKKKSTSISEGSKATENDVKKLSSVEENQQKDAITSVEHVEKSRQIQKNEENNTSVSDSKENNSNEVGTTAVDLAEASERKSPISKPKYDIVKSMAKNFLKTRKSNVTSEVPRKKQKKKSTSISEGSKATENDVKKLSSVEENQQKDAITSVEHVEKSSQIQKNEENNTSVSDSKENITKSQNDPEKQRNCDEPGLSNNKKKNEEKREGNGRRRRNERKEKNTSDSVKNNSNEEKREGNERRRRNERKEKNTSDSVKNNSNEEKHDGKGKNQELQKKEKIDGLIFMCNAKTKPDCFKYRVLGVSGGKKDLVLDIRPGLKLFLYDYDLRLMYGIYKASSAGGMKLEPKAFGGAFPAQVRFRVHADCFPLAESIFKKAITENYYEKNKFKFELTARQVRKLTELFRPVPVHSTAPPFHSSSRASARNGEHPEKREVHDGPREARPLSHREASVRDPYANISARGFAALPRERDQRAAYGESASTKREDGQRDLYLSEKEYRAYGLQGDWERRNLTPQHHIIPTLTSYLGDHRELPLQQPDTVRSNPLYLTEREYRTYDLGATREGQPIVSAATANTSLAGASIVGSYIADPYYGRYSGDPLVDAYLPRPGTAHLIEPDHLRRENQADRLYSSYRSDALADSNQMQRHQDVKLASASTSVSSRYLFDGAYRL